MVACQFFLGGHCKFGDRCRNEHLQDGHRQGNFGNQVWTPANPTANKAQLFNVESMATDLSPENDKPIWPLSSYGPAKHVPTLIGGIDESPEELRVKAAQALKAGTTADYVKYETEKTAAANQTFARARANVQQLYNQASGNSTASAFGAMAAPVSAFGPSSASAFGAASGFGAFAGPAPSAFGSPGAASASAFGKSTFGQPAPATGSAFGQASQSISAFGSTQQPTSVFAQSTQPASAFGQTSQPASVFGQPAQPASVFGQSAQPAPAFGATSQPASSVFAAPAVTSAFGQTASAGAFGQSSVLKPAIGAFGASTGGAFGAFANSSPSASAATGTGFAAFSGQPAAFGLGAANNVPNSVTPAPAFGQSGFGGSSAPVFGTTPTPAAFGATSGFGALAQNQTAAPSTFGAPAQTGSAFAVPTVTSAFGATANNAPTAFGSTSGPQSAFGALAANQPQSAFASASQGPSTSAFGASAHPASVFGAPSQPAAPAFGVPVPPQPAFGAAASHPLPVPTKPAAKGGKPDFEAAMLRVKAIPGTDPYDALLPDNYLQIIPQNAREAFESRKFEWGKIPEWIPPKELR